ncbi:MAG: hypothetical protein U0R71_08685 [Solirubrobacterales bacterium]
MDRSHHSVRPAAVLAALGAAAVLAMFAPPRAAAEDTFRFENETGKGFTAGGRDTVPECWFGASGVLAPQTEPQLTGRISADVGPFESCGGFWSTTLSYDQEFLEDYEMEGQPGALWRGGVGGFAFDAEDPSIGPATLSCSAAGREWAELGGAEPIENLMSSEVEGTVCTVEWLPGAGPQRLARASAVAPADARYSHFVSSLAAVEGGAARVAVQTFARRKLAVADEVVLRTRSGAAIGHATVRLRVGDRARRAAVPLSAAARRALGKRGYLVVRATIRHVDGSPGSGDRTSRLVLRRPNSRR